MVEKEGVSGMKTLLALLYAPGDEGKPCEDIKGRTKLEKMLFLLQKNNFPLRDYEFEAYDFGPCTMKLYDDLEVLIGYNWVDIKEWKYEDVIEMMDAEVHDEECQERKIEIFSLTDDGEKKGEQAFKSLDPKLQNVLITVKKEFNPKPLIEILRYVYDTWPEMEKESTIKEKIHRISMFGTKKDIPSFTEDEEW